MPKEPDILKIVKEDILRILGETKKEVLLDSIKAEIKVSPSFVSQAIKGLEEENQILVRKNFIRLTKELHLCHVFAVSSDSLFIENVYKIITKN